MNPSPAASLPRRLLSLTLRLCLAGACLIYALWDLDLQRAAETLAAFRGLPLFLSLLLGLYLSLIQGVRFRAITGPRATLTQATLACVLGNGLNNIFPARLGELGKALYLKRHTSIPMRESLGFIFWERFADLNMILALAALASLVSGKRFVWLPLALTLAGIWLSVAAVLLLPAARGLLPRLVPFPSLRRVCADMLDHFVKISTPRFLLLLVLLSALTWVSFTATFIFNTNTVMGLNAGLDALLVIYAATSLSFLIPSSPGGLGLFEAAMVFSFAWFGLGREQALVAALLLRLTQNMPTVIVTVLLLGKEHLGPRALKEAFQAFRSAPDSENPAN
ncbi:flippase-like domain-containing protein [Desulfovibrio aminophilus]|nr:lysylphosphatidylglycerol synthase transmembrane domain-containing protein [Desulfovibrio aminophilus]MCM0756007.1 flippase-like domain-containing protein [Desulfovibrio aminophilus]